MVKGFDMDLAEHIEAQSQFQKGTQEGLREIAKELDGCLEELCSVSVTLQDKLRFGKESPREAAPPAPPQAVPAAAQPAVTNFDDYKASIEKMLQGSIDSFGDKLSGKLLDLVKELKNSVGPAREEKIKEIHHEAKESKVDLANLFLHDKVKSNLSGDDLKVEEKNVSSVQSILDKLKKFQGGRGDGEKDRGKP